MRARHWRIWAPASIPRFTFETFVVGKPNEFAVAAAERVASSPKPPFNPLFLYGGVGLGKTHLMHAIAHRVKQHDADRRVVYLSAEKFMYQFVRALRSKDTMTFKELFRSVDLLMVDDVQFISGKDSTQEEFFHTFNTLVDRGRQIVISADRSPSDLSGLEERIRSRLGWGLVADIHPTTYELRLGILQAKAEQLGVTIPPRVVEFLASRITSNVRELEGAMNRIVHQASLVQKPISIDMAQEVLKDLLRANDRRVTIEEIQKAVVEHYSIRMADMTSARRSRAVARPRQMAMYLAKQLTPRSLPEIGKKFGGRDHTTVMHAVRQIEKLDGRGPHLGRRSGGAEAQAPGLTRPRASATARNPVARDAILLACASPQRRGSREAAGSSRIDIAHEAYHRACGPVAVAGPCPERRRAPDHHPDPVQRQARGRGRAAGPDRDRHGSVAGRARAGRGRPPRHDDRGRAHPVRHRPQAARWQRDRHRAG